MLFAVSGLSAQEFSIENYIYNKAPLAPAYAGFNGNIETYVQHSKQWTGISGAPQLTGMNIQFPAFYAGAFMVNMTDYSTGNFSNLSFDVSYVHHFEVNKNLKFAFALTPELYRNQIELSQVVSQGTDPALTNISALQTTFVDIGGSMIFSYKDFLYGGFGARSLAGTDGSYKNSSLQYRQSGNYNLNLNYKYQISEYTAVEAAYVLQLYPSDYKTVIQQVSVLFNYKHKLFGGLLYQTPSKTGLTAGGIISDNILLTYTYTAAFSGIDAVSGGSHHLNLGFLIKRNTVHQITDIFPVSEQQQLLIENEDEMKELNAELARVKSQLNRVVSSYDKRFKAIEERNKIADRTKIQNKLNLKFGEPVPLPSVCFPAHSAVLMPSAKSDLNRIVNMMVKDAGISIKLTIFVKNIGTERLSYDLARARAKTIRQYLKDKGINIKRIMTEVKLSDNDHVKMSVAY